MILLAVRCLVLSYENCLIIVPGLELHLAAKVRNACFLFGFECTNNASRTYIKVAELGLALLAKLGNSS